MKHKVDDTVRVQSQEWMDAQRKDHNGLICGENIVMNSVMQGYAGREARVVEVRGRHYVLDIDERYIWDDWMLDQSRSF